MSRRTALSCGLLVACLCFVTPAAQQEKDGVRAEPATAAEANARVALAAAAREAWDVLQLRVEAGEALTPTFVELIGQASRRLCLAEREASEEKAPKAKALGEHLDRMKQLHAILDQRFKLGVDVSRVQVAQATYFVREAELWVAQSPAR